MTALLAETTRPDAVVFGLSALIILAGALGVVVSRHPVHSALMLVMTLFGIAVTFVSQGAHFLAAVQVIVYAGAIVVLFLFVIMLIGVDKREALGKEPLRLQRPLAFLLGAVLLAELFLLTRAEWVTGKASTVERLGEDGEANVEQLAEQLFTRYLLAFEVTSALLVIAVIGAVVLARRSTGVTPEPEGEA